MRRSRNYEHQLQLGSQKILAGVLGVPLRTLTQKDKAYQLEKARRRARQLTAWLSLTAVLAAAAIAAAVFAVDQKRQADHQRELAETNEQRAQQRRRDAEELVNFMTFELVEGLKHYVPNSVRQPIIERIDAYYAKQDLSQQTEDEIRSRSVHLSKSGDLALNAGNLSEALKLYSEALEITERLVELDPSNTEFQRDVSVSYIKLADVGLQLGETDAALADYNKALKITERLVELDPSNTLFQRDVSVS